MLNISNIQHFSVGDGDGIRTTVFFKGCNLCCPWCHNPENLKCSTSVLKYPDKDEVMGKKIEPADILPELSEDIEFYKTSDGGVTLSGGECMLQATAIVPLLKLLKAQGIDVLIDTAGCVPYSKFKKLNGLVAGYLFDFKTADADKYARIGGDLELVKNNILQLLKDGQNVHIRIPLIPDFNTGDKSVDGICTCLKDMGITAVELLPFHRLGSAKYKALGIEYAYADCEPLSANELLKLENKFKKYFNVKTER